MKKIKTGRFAKLLLIVLISSFSCMQAYSATSKKTDELKLTSHYVDKINNYKLSKNLVKDYGVSPNSMDDQSSKIQHAIDDVSHKGGGKLIIPKGTYFLREVNMKSNVHILVDKDAVLKIYWDNKSKNVAMFNFSSEKDNADYIKDCSIRGLNGKYTVDYSYLNPGNESGVRFIICRLIKNFLIADANIKDNYTKFCGIIFVPTSTKGADSWEISRPTNGEIRNCSITNANSGYGLCQLHGAQSLYFRKLYAKGGVTLRLESGAGGRYAGVFDIQAKNIQNEYGRAAVMMNPHTTHNGTVLIDSVWSNSSSACLLLHKGFIDKKHKNDPDATVGTYANDSKINNVHAIFGTEAQVDGKEVYILEPNAEMYAKFHLNSYGNNKSFQGPSLATIFNSTEGNWNITVTNVTSEGFKGAAAGMIKIEDIKDREKNKWDILNSLPIMKDSTTQNLKEKSKKEKEPKAKKKEDKSKKKEAKTKKKKSKEV